MRKHTRCSFNHPDGTAAVRTGTYGMWDGHQWVCTCACHEVNAFLPCPHPASKENTSGALLRSTKTYSRLCSNELPPIEMGCEAGDDVVPAAPPHRGPWQDYGMERVVGIGGHFMRAADPAALSAWYRDCLGLDADENGLWSQEAGPTVFATFESETDYFGSRAQQAMINFRVRDLDAMLAQLRAKGTNVVDDVQEMEGVGRFGWVTDPEGNRIELWQPA